MIRLFSRIFFDEGGGLGITRLSLVCCVCDDTGDSSEDAVVKIRRLIERRGPQFCAITQWPFLRDEVTFNITNALGHTYSGSSYLPDTFKRVVTAHIVDSTDNFPLTEIGIKEFKELPNPTDNEERPSRFCITRIESGYWQIAFDHKPDQTYAVYFEIELRWTALTADTTETIITKPYCDAFTHFVSMARLRQQGDLEQYSVFKNEWWSNIHPEQSILGIALGTLESPADKNAVEVDEKYLDPIIDYSDYNDKVDY